MVDVVTGRPATFTITITCEGRGGLHQEGGDEGVRERVGSAGREDLQIWWEYQPPRSSFSSVITSHSEEEGEAIFYSAPTPFTHRVSVFVGYSRWTE